MNSVTSLHAGVKLGMLRGDVEPCYVCDVGGFVPFWVLCVPFLTVLACLLFVQCVFAQCADRGICVFFSQYAPVSLCIFRTYVYL